MNRIQENISKALLLIITVITLIAPTNVFAKDNYERIEKQYYVAYKCTIDQDHCVPLCMYEDEKANAMGYIGYYYDSAKTGSSKWEINAQINDHLASFKDPTKIPVSGIFWEDSKADDWEHATNEEKRIGYWALDSYLECPKLISIDNSGTDVELCFANSKNKCEKQDNWDLGTNFKDEYKLSYSFIDELKKVIDKTYNDNYMFESTTLAEIVKPGEYPAGPEGLEKLEKEKIGFIYDLDPNMTINEEATAEQNATEYCEYLKESLQDDEKIEEYISKLKGEYASTFSNKYYQDLQKNAEAYKTNGLTNLNFYKSKENIESLLKDRKIKDANNIDYLDKLDTGVFAQRFDSSMKYFEEKCKYVKDVDINYEENSEKIKEKIKENYETIVYGDVSINDKTQLSCGDISELADLIKTAYFIIEVIAVVILIGLSSLDYAKVILNGEQDEIKKCNKKLLTRLIITVIIFLLPGLINFTLKIFNIEGFNSETPLCVEISNK